MFQESIPAEILIMIGEYLHVQDWLSLRVCCRYFQTTLIWQRSNQIKRKKKLVWHSIALKRDCVYLLQFTGYKSNFLSLQESLCMACSHGSENVVKHLLEHTDVKVNRDCFTNTGYSGNVELMKFILQNKRKQQQTSNLLHDAFKEACHHGHLAMVRFLLHECNVWTNQGLMAAIDCNQDAVLSLLIDEKTLCKKDLKQVIRYIEGMMKNYYPVHLQFSKLQTLKSILEFYL